MQFSSVVLSLSALVAAGLVAAQTKLVVNTNSAITTCVANRLTWSGGVAPYNVYIIVPLHPETQLAILGQTSNNYIVYTPDGKTKGIQVGDTVAVYVTDNQGNTNGSAGVTINSSGTGSCTASSSGTGSGSSVDGPTSTATPSSFSTSRPNNTPSSATSPAAATTDKPGAAAPGLKASAGVLAGVVGLIMAAVM